MLQGELEQDIGLERMIIVIENKQLISIKIQKNGIMEEGRRKEKLTGNWKFSMLHTLKIVLQHFCQRTTREGNLM